MLQKLRGYNEIFKNIAQQPLFKWFFRAWAIVATYDLIVSQFVPEEYAKLLPKAWQVAMTTGNILPLWGWALILAAILVVSSLEFAYRLKRAQGQPSAGAPSPPPEQPTADELGDLSRALGYSRATLERNPTPENAKLLLAQLRSSGVVHRNMSALIEDDQVEDWIAESHRWLHRVADTLKKIDETDAEMFQTLDIVKPARVIAHHQITDPWMLTKFQNSYNQHDLRLSKLEKLLLKYQGLTS